MDRVKYMRGEEGGVKSIIEIMDELGNEVPPKHGDTWGEWKLNGYGGHWTLDHAHRYSVNLNGITSNAAMNDWTFQLAQKTWVTAEDLGNLILAFQDIFHPQTNLCGSERDRRIPPDFVNTVLGEPLAEAEPEEEDPE